MITVGAKDANEVLRVGPWVRGCFEIVGWDKRRTTEGYELPQRQRSPTSFAKGFETASHSWEVLARKRGK